MCVQIAAKKGRPSTCPLITGRSPVPASAGPSQSDHSGVLPVKIHWLHTWVVRLRDASAGRYRRSTCNQGAGTGPAFFSRYLNVRPLFGSCSQSKGILYAHVVNSLILKNKDNATFADGFFNLFLENECLPSQFCKRSSWKSLKLRRDNHGIKRGEKIDNQNSVIVCAAFVTWASLKRSLTKKCVV